MLVYIDVMMFKLKMNHNRYELIIIGPIKFSLEKQTTFNMGFLKKP
jgi:hypothetical protein